MNCPTCGFQNAPGMRFCGQCGSRIDTGCATCGFQNPPGMRFCGQCGATLEGGPDRQVAPLVKGGAAPVPVGSPALSEPQTERRVVTVLFADLVGFTARSDGSDPEQVREFLASYFELCRETIELYGGTVEKFIGDAVMAVWGTPVAREDDPERAVRAAMELVDSLRRIGRETGDEALALRAGVLTGEAAVTLGAEGQGMVAGDLVNTASRLQSVAPSGAVLVGESTYRVASRAIVFEAAGDQQLKGKEAPVPAWVARRVVAERGGLGRSEGIEAPFVGRDDELRLLKDILHQASRERRVRLVSVTGQAGVGKSRLAWEYLKYIDGVLEPIYYHHGRSPAFGEGVTFWALGEMVRRRAKLAEGDDEATTRDRIAATLAEYVPDEEERRRLEPAILSLLGVGEAPGGGRDELFAALRTFFERISILGTTVLVFEDLQWADAGVLDFIEHLLDWSIGYPIVVVTLARPELLERRPDWGAGRRELVALALGPLSEGPMRELLAGLVPDLPERTTRAILERADGIPLYAVEMVRMLVADGRLEEADGVYHTVGDLGDLRVPDTLQSLIASRLDALEPADRSLLQDGAVLGQTFSVPALAALTGETPETLEPRLRALVRREVLQLDTDPRSPERGQFGFTQALVREVAYATLSKRDRRAKHLAAARYFETLEDEEVAGVLATHYVDAWTAAPDGPEGEAVAAQARIALRAAADRAVALGSQEQAVALLERARQVTTDRLEEAELLERMGRSERAIGHYEASAAHLEEAIARYREAEDRIGVVRATTLLCRTSGGSTANTADALAMAIAAEAEFTDLAPDPALAGLRAAIAALSNGIDDYESSVRWADLALVDAERSGDLELVADLLVTKGSVFASSGRWREGTALLEAGYRLASKNGLVWAAARAANNMAASLIDSDPSASVAIGREGVELARRYGYRSLLLGTLMNATEAAIQTGDLAWAEAEFAAVVDDDLEPVDLTQVLVGRVELGAITDQDVEDHVRRLVASRAGAADPQFDTAIAIGLTWAAFAAGDLDAAFRLAMEAARPGQLNEPGGLALAASISIIRGDRDDLQATIERLDALGARGPQTDLVREDARAGKLALDGRWGYALGVYQELWRRQRDGGLRFSRALSQLGAAAAAPDWSPAAAAIAAEARGAFVEAGARAFVRQVDALVTARSSSGGSKSAEESAADDGSGAEERPGASVTG
jgi:class 3 adenylate cyclase/tetratricopeptide (TPR) repeat protein